MRHLFDGQYPKLVLFDLDGTLVDSVPDLASAVDRMLIALLRPAAGVEKVRCWVGNGAPMLVKRALADCMCPSDADDPLFEKAYALFLQFYGESTAGDSVIYPGVLRCLQGLREAGVPMGLVTNKPIHFTHHLLSGMKIDHFFGVVLGGDSLAKKKPDPLPLQEIMRRFEVSPAETLMVGDSISDVNAARAAGCAIACVPYGYNHGEDIAMSDPDLMVERLDMLL